MSHDSVQQIGLLFFEALFLSVLLLAFFRVRNRFGLAPLCVTLGAFQHLQTTLAAALYLEIFPGIYVSPGSTVLFTATLVMTLLVYIRDDAAEARSLIVGIVAANVTLSIVALLVNLHLSSPLLVLMQDVSGQFLVQNLWSLLIGTCLLCADVILVIVLYEFFYRLLPRALFARIALSIVCVVTIDTTLFVSISFYDSPDFSKILLAGVLGKTAFGVFYAFIVSAYLRLFPVPNLALPDDAGEGRKVFHILTYRQRYELLKDELMREPMTGLFNRKFFNDNLPRELRRAQRLEHQLNVLLLDLDNFKQINDRYGHQAGDDVILLMAQAMQESFRAADIPCRYGGEEFAVILPDATTDSATIAARRLREKLSDLCHAADLPLPAGIVTFTAGIASYPADADSPDELVR
ncbi:MAG: GGDEF domain-containing protein, partial [Woeseia sp.]|nr:GGDEF domain-containing protein [Woeseia sp.]